MSFQKLNFGAGGLSGPTAGEQGESDVDEPPETSMSLSVSVSGGVGPGVFPTPRNIAYLEKNIDSPEKRWWEPHQPGAANPRRPRATRVTMVLAFDKNNKAHVVFYQNLSPANIKHLTEFISDEDEVLLEEMIEDLLADINKNPGAYRAEWMSEESRAHLAAQKAFFSLFAASFMAEKQQAGA